MSVTRKSLRKQTDSFLAVYDRGTDELIGRLVDMTTEGVKLRSMKAMDPGVVFQFRMDLPVELKGCKEIVFDAKSVWSKRDEVSHEYFTGFAMQEISNTEVEKIELLLESPLFAADDKRVHVTVTRKPSSE